MSAILQRGSLFAVVKETTPGTLVAPTLGSQAIPLRPGYAMEYTVEELQNDEVISDKGATKSIGGTESVNGTHPAYLKGSELAGVAPEVGVLIESSLGTVVEAATEYTTAASSTAKVIKVGSGVGANFQVGQALMVKDTTVSIRNIESISGDNLTLNFALPSAPAAGVSLGKAVLYKPAATSPTFSAWLYNGNGGAIQAAAGCQTSNISMTFNAGEQALMEFTYEGSKYYFNPIILPAVKYLDFTDDSGTYAAAVAAGIYASPLEMQRALQAAIDATATTEDLLVSYSNTSGMFTISTATSSVLSLLFVTGTNTANDIGSYIGFTTDQTGATSYTGTAQSLVFPFTADYDDASNIVVKEAELLIGDVDDILCKCARTVNVVISTPVVNVECICAVGGIQEKVSITREVTMTAELILNPYDVSIFDKLKNNSSIKAMLNVGPKANGNWVAAKAGNIYLGNASVTGNTIGGDDFAFVNVTVKGYVTSTLKDVYINYV